MSNARKGGRVMTEYYYDIHSHIIPCVDDGARDIEETRAMLLQAYEEGIRTIIATPHYNQDAQEIEKLMTYYELTKIEAKKIHTDFRIYLGNEIYYMDNIIEQLNGKNAFTMADSRYVLVEFSPEENYKDMYDGVRNLITEGYAPIMAHIERYECLKKLDKVKELIDLGAYTQVNARSLMGGILNKRTKYCKQLLKHRLIHFVGSDCHNTKYRKPILKGSIKLLQKYLTESECNQILYQNPSQILINKYI